MYVISQTYKINPEFIQSIIFALPALMTAVISLLKHVIFFILLLSILLSEENICNYLSVNDGDENNILHQ